MYEVLDFVKIKKTNKNMDICPDFVVNKNIKDLMIRGHAFYAVWDEEVGLWSTNEYDVQRLVDEELYSYNQSVDNTFNVQTMGSWSTNHWTAWKNYSQKMPDIYHELDTKVTFTNTKVKREDYVSKTLPYALEPCDISNYDKIMSTLYDPIEREKLEWAIGSIISGDSRFLQKFIVIYGASGTGKSTFLNIVQMLFDGYYSVFEAKALASANNSFALEAFRTNPLIAIQHDGDLSRIEDNTKLNSIVSHETMLVNEKHKSQYEMRFQAFLFMGTNSPVKITDARSGIIRRLIDVRPSDRKLPYAEYMDAMDKIQFELGGIACHCLDIYKKRGPGYYNDYIPMEMLGSTNSFYDFILENYDIFKKEDSTTLKGAWMLYKEYVDYARIPYPLPLQRFKEELKAYFDKFVMNGNVNGSHVRNAYFGFKTDKIDGYSEKKVIPETDTWLKFEEATSVFDILAADYPAQCATKSGTPQKPWAQVTTVLKDIPTNTLHYVKLPINHIVIDFDIRDESGNKSLAKNIEAASKFPPTYAELSKSGSGIHLHYIYDGDPELLSAIYDNEVEIKVFKGNSSLRRQFSQCVNNQIAHINSGLPLKGSDKKMFDGKCLKNEKAIRTAIKRNLNKEYHAKTKPSVDFIFKILEDAYNGGVVYDVTDMRPAVQAFAINSTNNADYCLKLVGKMKFKSEKEPEDVEVEKDIITFFDVEVFPNLFVVCWKHEGEPEVHSLINPSSNDISKLVEEKLVGFNNRKYDNHILYAAMIGYSNEELYKLSQRIIGNESRNASFLLAYNLSYTDIYDFASAGNKKSLKKWEIELGINHQENEYPWDQPVPVEKWNEIVEYCCNDVKATEAVFNHLHGDFIAREILADIADSTPNDTTNSLTTKIIFGKEKHPQLVYTDLSIEFPGYEFVPCGEDGKPHNMYRGEDVGFGGYVYAEPGMYGYSKTFDVTSQHPHSILALNMFGDYTPKFKELLDARIAIKHEDYDILRTMLGGKLNKYIDQALESGDKKIFKSISNALKTAINSVYGLTSAKFDNPFRDIRNVNNIVALRGALFMCTLKDEVMARGYKVIHIKTDSIKIENPDEEITNFVMEFGKKYGYSFEVEHSFEKICLVNNAVYVAKLAEDDPEEPGEWTATGAQFKHPYVFKTLFSKEPLEFADYCETKSTKTAMYLDFNENLPENEHNFIFVGKVGSFVPVVNGCNGGLLLRDNENGGYNAVVGTKGYRWMESETVKNLDMANDIDINYYEALNTEAINTIYQFGDFWSFVDDVPFDGPYVTCAE